MECLVRTPGLLRLKDGHFYEPQPTYLPSTPPKIIHYKHTIRHLPSPCNHQTQIQNLRRAFMNQLQQKQDTIDKLNKTVEQINHELLSKDKEINQLYQSQQLINHFLTTTQQHKIELSHIELQNDSQVSVNLYESSISQRKISEFELIYHQHQHNDNLQVLKVKEEMKNTKQALKNITDSLNKPKKKYQFYNKFEEKIKQQVPSLATYSKNLADTNFQLTLQPIQRPHSISPSKIQGCKTVRTQYDQQIQDDQLDLTNFQQQSDTLTFLQQASKQHQKLKEMLINLEIQSKKEFQQMKMYYQREIQSMIASFGFSSSKEEEDNDDWTRNRIELGYRNSFDSSNEEQAMKWRQKNKFQIIFPEDNQEEMTS